MCGYYAQSFLRSRLFRHRILVSVILAALVGVLLFIRYELSLMLFIFHPPISVRPVVTDGSTMEGRPEVPLFVLSASEARWKEFVGPKGTKVQRVQQPPQIEDAYARYLVDPESWLHAPGNVGTLRCGTGHLYIWDMIARDPRCAQGCLIAEDDAQFPGLVDPRPYMDTWADLNPVWDLVTLWDLPLVSH